ncbi:helix-turn-helix transcriptional regulator [Promicromonospora sp. NPDC023805]|jgi:ribosome-binding protein aMBF1 (putative translation factor)|uniref:helix-turn-helix domain-containing protein n=1 Tax=Promicromonospora sp. NPDC023805 TaxID=3154696 RepID=UPI0033F34E86
MRTTSWRELQAESLAAMTPDERAEYDLAGQEAELKLRLAELVYNARTGAGLSQTELARRVGTSQSVISSIENGAQVPTVPTLFRIARALDQDLRVEISAA